MSTSFHYLLVSQVPFARMVDGKVMIDTVWAQDLRGLASGIGPIRIVAPQVPAAFAAPNGARLHPSSTWAPIEPSSGLTFFGLPAISSRWDAWRWSSFRAVLRREVACADVVHSFNVSPPYVGLSYAHDEAVRQGKPTVFVIAEDFYDRLEWEWVRVTRSRLQQWCRRRILQRLDERARRSAATASLTFLHTPAVVARYRLVTRRGVAIRQPEHELEDVITPTALAEKCTDVLQGATLQIIAVCQRETREGLDCLLQALQRLAMRGVRVEARVCGDEAIAARVAAEAQRRGVDDRVFFSGVLEPGTATLQVLAQGHICVMPQRTADFGRIFFDALAGGTPVIAFRTITSVETVRDGVDGLLVPADDVESLAAALERFHTDRAFLVRASEAARARALIDTCNAWQQFRTAHIKALLQARSSPVSVSLRGHDSLLVGQA